MASNDKPVLVTKIGNLIERFFTPIVHILKKIGFTANMISFLHFPFIFLTLYYFIQKDIYGVIISLSITLFLDVFDGSFARITKTVTKLGHYLDKIIDLISITVFITGIMIYIPEKTDLLIIILILSYLIYFINEFTTTQVVGGVRSIGLIALIVNMVEEGLYIILLISIGGLIFKIFKLLKMTTNRYKEEDKWMKK